MYNQNFILFLVTSLLVPVYRPFCNFLRPIFAELILQSINDMTTKFSGQVDHSVKLCTIILLYFSGAISWSSARHKYWVQILNKNCCTFWSVYIFFVSVDILLEVYNKSGREWGVLVNNIRKKAVPYF